MPKPHLRLTTRIHPSPAQDARLQLMWTTLLAAQHTLIAWLHHRAGGGTRSLLAFACGHVTAGHPRLNAQPLPTVDQLNAEVKAARDALGWTPTVPPGALRWMTAETAREWRAAGQLRPRGPLPGPWPPSRAPELHLDNSVQVLDPVTLRLAPGGPDELVPADLYLPTPLWHALLRRQQRRAEHERVRHDALERAWLDAGDGKAAAELLIRRARGGPWTGLPWPDLPEPRPGDPASREGTILRWIDGDGLPARWVVEWRFGAGAGEVPGWVHDDMLGVDLGYHHPFACAARGVSRLMPRPFRGSFAPPLIPGCSTVPPYHEAWARAQHRRALFLRLRPLLESHLALALGYRAVAVERLAWAGFARRGFPFGAYALDVGLVAWLDWLGALAPQHGVTVLQLPPAYTSRTCSACLWVGPRPQTGRPFRCAACGHTSQPDLNAARVLRRQGRTALGWP